MIALGFATIFMLASIEPVVEPEQRAFYHWSGPAARFFLPTAIHFLAVWLALTLLLWASRSPGRKRVMLWSGLLLVVPWSILKSLEALGLVHPNHLGRVFFLGALLATILLTAFWRPTFARRFESFVASASTVLIFLGLFGGLMLCRLAWYGWQGTLLASQLPLQYAHAFPPAKPHRIIWILMDELSYDQTFAHRFPGLALPAFDALASDATSFTQDIPADIQTEVVLPGLLAGRNFDNIRTSAYDRLSAHNADTGKWQPFNQHNTVFQDAKDAGFGTAIAGWFNPYCRIVPQVVDQCYWTYNRDSTATVVSVALAPLEGIIGSVPTFGFDRMVRLHKYLMHPLQSTLEKESQTYLHIADYQALDAASSHLLRDPSASFVLLHIPVPHPAGIYDRHTARFTETTSSYINNLALADKYLGGLRQTLEQTGQWDSSTIVVMGDHSWRTRQIWWFPKLGHAWSWEDNQASRGGQYDPRPVYLVKLPNQTTSARIDSPYQAYNTRKLFDAIMAHQINTPTDLSTWAHALPATH